MIGHHVTNLLYPEESRSADVPMREVHLNLPVSVVEEMDRVRKRHSAYLWGNSRSYFTEMALKWFSNFLQEGGDDHKATKTGIQKASQR